MPSTIGHFLPYIYYAYVGPRNVAQNDPTFFGHWDWFTDCAHLTTTPIKYLGKRILASQMTGSSTSFNYTGAALPPAAGVWIGPNAAGEGWEYVSYYTFGGGITCTREIQEGQNGNHTAGAPIYLWFPLEMNNGTLEYDLEQSENMSTSVWTAKLGGVMAPNQVLKPEQLLMVSFASVNAHIGTPPTELTCLPLIVGFIERVHMQNDFDQHGLWDIDIVCTSRLLDTSKVPGLRIGPVDVAEQASAEASSSLGANWKILMPQMIQAQSGAIEQIDLIEAQEDCGPQNIVDGNEDTIWISDGWVGDPNLYLNLGHHHTWCSVFCNPPPSAPYGTKYIEIINYDDLAYADFYVFAKWSIRDAAGAVIAWRMHWYWGCEPNLFLQSGIQGGAFGDAGDSDEQRVIIAEDASVFRKTFPAAAPMFLLDASTFSGYKDVEAARRIWWEAGAIFWHWQFPADKGGSTGTDHLLIWGNTDKTEVETVWNANNLASFSFPDQNCKIDYTTLVPGEVFRRDLTVPTGMVFTHDFLHHPGYVIDRKIDADLDANASRRSEWIRITLPEMSHLLFDDIDATTHEIFVVDAQGQPNVEGISLSGSGVVIIDAENIPFTGIDYVLGKLTGCTVVQSHKAKSKVYVQLNILAFGKPNPGQSPTGYNYPTGYKIPEEGKTLSIASNHYPIERIEWGRGKYPSGADRTPFIGNYVMRFSLDPDAPNPTIDTYENGYMNTPIIDTQTWATDTDHVHMTAPNVSQSTLLSEFQPAGNGFRPASILIQIREMWNSQDTPTSASTERPRLNYFRANVDRRFYNTNTWLDLAEAGQSNETVIQSIFVLSGQLDTLFYYISSPTIQHSARKKGITDRDTAWRVATDLADYGESVIRCQRTGNVGIGVNAYLLQADHSPLRSFDDSDITSLEIVNVRPNEVGQIRLTWEDGLTGKHGITSYPVDNRYGGDIIEIGPMLATDKAQADLIALNLYKTKRFAYNVFVEFANTDLTFQCGDIHQLSFDFNKDGYPLIKHLMVETVNLSIADGVIKTRVGYREIDRTAV